MSITVLSVDHQVFRPKYDKNIDLYEVAEHCSVWIFCRLQRAGGSNQSLDIKIDFYPGFRSDGASGNFLTHLVIPRFDSGNMVFNIANFVHDALYATKGIHGMLTREECDDVIRGLWRISGMSRVKAGIGDVVLHLFGWTKKHWGNDSLKCKNFVRFRCY